MLSHRYKTHGGGSWVLSILLRGKFPLILILIHLNTTSFCVSSAEHAACLSWDPIRKSIYHFLQEPHGSKAIWQLPTCVSNRGLHFHPSQREEQYNSPLIPKQGEGAGVSTKETFLGVLLSRGNIQHTGKKTA
jgi:hypothetical protein